MKVALLVGFVVFDLLTMLAIVFLVRRARARAAATARPQAGTAPAPPAVSSIFSQWLAKEAEKRLGAPILSDPLAMKRIEEAAAKALEELKTNPKTTVSVPFLTADASGPKHFTMDISLDDLP